MAREIDPNPYVPETKGHGVPEQLDYTRMAGADLKEGARRALTAHERTLNFADGSARCVSGDDNLRRATIQYMEYAPRHRCIGCGAPDPLVKGSYCLRCVVEGDRR